MPRKSSAQNPSLPKTAKQILLGQLAGAKSKNVIARSELRELRTIKNRIQRLDDGTAKAKREFAALSEEIETAPAA